MSASGVTRLSFAFLCFFYFSPDVKGENPGIAIIWNQLWARQFCFEVESSAIDQIELECGSTLKKPVGPLRVFSWKVFERAVFTRAAELQVAKDACLIDQLCAVSHADDPNKDKEGKVECNGHKVKASWVDTDGVNRKENYVIMLALAWIGIKKAQLILRTCQALNDPEPLVPGRVKIKSPAEAEKWRGVCSDQSNIEVLKEAETIYSMGLPLISSSALFDVIESNRAHLINVKTGQPLSDADILSQNFTDKDGNPQMGFLKIDRMRTVFQPQVTKELEHLIKERQSLLRTTRAFAKKSASFPIDADIKNYLFRDGTVDRVLEESGQISENENGDPSETAGASCIHSRYRESMTGAIVDFTANMLLGAQGFKYVARKAAAKTGGSVLAGKELSSAASKFGTGYATALDFKRQVARSCFSRAHRAANLDASGNTVKRLKVADLDSGQYNTFFAFTDEETPNCSSESEKKRIANELLQVNCIKDAFLSIAPVSVALPMILTSY